MNILDKIVIQKRKEVEIAKKTTSIEELKNKPYYNRESNSFRKNVLAKKGGIIAEFKRQSPSKGIINNTSLPRDVAEGYEKAGVAGMSVLTDKEFFGGTANDLIEIRSKFPTLPLLRKEFIIDEFQIHEAKVMGADMILLIVAILTKDEIASFTKLAHNLGLEVLAEVHNEEEALLLNQDIDLVGVNNRNLKTFEVDVRTSIDLLPKLPPNAIKISESGISDISTIQKLQKAGYQGFLIGENFMKTGNPSSACIRFIDELTN